MRFKLSQPYPDFGRNQSFLRIISPKLIKQGKKAVAKRPTGTGPYRFGKIVPGQYTTLPANTEHWGTGPYFAELRLPLVSQLSARVAALSTGQIDVVNRLAPPQAAQFAGNHDVSLPTTGPSWAQGYFLFKVNNVNVRDLAVRQAVAWGLDREAIVKSILLGRATVADSSLPPGVYGFAKPATTYAYNPDKARQILKAAGLSNPKLRMVSFANVHVLGEQVGQAAAAQMKDVGFDVTFDILDDTVGTQDFLQGKHDMYFDEYFWLNGGPLQLSLNFPTAYTGWSNSQYAKLLAQMQVTPDGPARERLLAQMQELLARFLPWMPMHTHILTDGVRANIHGYQPPKDGLMPRYEAAFRAA